MPNYTFFPTRADGGSLTFTSADLLDDAHALTHAETVLLAHSSAVEVTIWEGERRVGQQRARSLDAAE